MTILKFDPELSTKGTWKGVGRLNAGLKGFMTCPACGHAICLACYTVAESGEVSPFIICPAGSCIFYDSVTLEGWHVWPSNADGEDSGEDGDESVPLVDEKQRADQMSVNFNWLLEKMDLVHESLCPGRIGTWQQRAEQVVEAAGLIAAKKRLEGLE